jgi:phosphoglycerate-specific signal transduction histidine kinase
MQKDNEKEKIVIIRELVRKRLIFGKDEEGELANDIFKVNLHVSIITFLANSAIDNVYGLKQIRRLVELDRLMDALLASSVPFLLKARYFRLFYAGYLQ